MKTTLSSQPILYSSSVQIPPRRELLCDRISIKKSGRFKRLRLSQRQVHAETKTHLLGREMNLTEIGDLTVRAGLYRSTHWRRLPVIVGAASAQSNVRNLRASNQADAGPGHQCSFGSTSSIRSIGTSLLNDRLCQLGNRSRWVTSQPAPLVQRPKLLTVEPARRETPSQTTDNHK